LESAQSDGVEGRVDRYILRKYKLLKPEAFWDWILAASNVIEEAYAYLVQILLSGGALDPN
jgi:hypothetical protein